ncbi:MAG: hypothetical protein FWG47_03910 [Propionibacteriaceae bacterium]|nr:hypothetical protein [Propionibacteriaceae bacterium]
MKKPRATRRKRWLACGTALAISMFALSVPPIVQAADTTPFEMSFSINAHGDLVTIGNTLMTCMPGRDDCELAMDDTDNYSNAGFIINLDMDDDPNTFNSSAALFTLPAGGEVLWAGLYWGARLSRGGTIAGGGLPASNATDRDKMLFKPPGTSDYATVTATKHFGPESDYQSYQEFAEVTDLVAAAGGGMYWGANVQAGTGSDRYAGWALTVVYQAPGMPLRNLNVFDGFQILSTGTAGSREVQVRLSGFLAPMYGPVNGTVTVVAWEGDGNVPTQTRAILQECVFEPGNLPTWSADLQTPLSSARKYFNSTNDFFGQWVTSGIPAMKNLFGVDIKNQSLPNVIPNGDGVNPGEACVKFTTNQDLYYPGVLGLAIDLYAPELNATKTVTNLSGNDPVQAGDILRYTVSFANTGGDAAANAIASDKIPENSTFVPGSLQLITRIDETTGESYFAPLYLTDAMGDDFGGYDEASKSVVVNLGQGATNSSGGMIPIGQVVSFSFDVTLDLPSSTGTTPGILDIPGSAGGSISNQATLDYTGAISGISGTLPTNQTDTGVATIADLALTKTMTPDPVLAGESITTTLTVTNKGPNVAKGVVVTDTMPNEITVDSFTATDGSVCPSEPPVVGATDQTLTCAIKDLAVGGVVTITIVGTADAALEPGKIINTAQVLADTGDPDMSNNTARASIDTRASADLAITKTVANATPHPGEVVTYTLTVTNLGPSVAKEVIVADVVQSTDNLKLVSLTSAASSSCTAGLATAQCALDDPLPPGESVDLTVVAWVTPDTPAGTVLTNSANVSATTPDSDTDNNEDTEIVTTSGALADLSLTKAGPSEAIAGESLTYTLTLTNNGPSDAGQTIVLDELPSGLTATSATTDRGSCDITNSGRVECTIDPLPGPTAPVAPGATAPDPATVSSASITIVALIDPAATGSLKNTATATPSQGDPVTSNQVLTKLKAVADLAITKTSPNSLLPNPAQTVEYRVELRNLGSSVAKGVQIVDALPAAFVLDEATWTLPSESGSPHTGSCSAPEPPTAADPDHQSITCDLPDMPVFDPDGNAADYTLVLTITMHADDDYDPTQVDTETEIVTVSADTDDPDMTNNTATWTLRGSPQADLAVEKTLAAGQGALVAGEQVTYQITATNLSTDQSAANVVITDMLGSGLTFVEATPAGCTASGQVITCPQSGLFAPGASASYQITAEIDPNFSTGELAENTATVSSSTPDPTLSNNTAVRTDPVTALADVAVTTSVELLGAAGSYDGPASARLQTITVTNNGPSVARSVKISAQIAPDATVDLAAITGVLPGSCTRSGSEVICLVDDGTGKDTADLTPGQEATITIPYQLLASATPGDYPDTAGSAFGVKATVSTTTPESDYDNNIATAPLYVGQGRTDIALAKTALTSLQNSDGHDAFMAGSNFSYRIEAEIAPGVADARDVVVDDQLPPGFIVTAAQSTLGSCTIAAGGGSVSCALGTMMSPLATDSSVPVVITINGSVDPSNFSDGTPSEVRYTNRATLTSSTFDVAGSNPFTASAQATVDVIAQSDLAITKTANAASFVAGALASWTVTVINAGPSDLAADQGTVTDLLPPGVTFNANGSDASCSASGSVASGQTLVCDLPALKSGESVSLQVAAQIPATALTGSLAREPIPDMTQVTNRALVEAPNDQNLDNNQAEVTTEIVGAWDQSVNGSVSQAVTAAGSYVTYTFTTTNIGASATPNPTTSIQFPAEFEIVSVTSPAALLICQQPNAAPNRVECTATPDAVFGTVALPGIPAVVMVQVFIPANTPLGDYWVEATVAGYDPSGYTVDIDLSNNTARVPIEVQLVADLALTKELVTEPIVAGQNIEYRLVATNLGPSAATGVTLTDQVPAQTYFISARLDDGTPVKCSLGQGAEAAFVACDLGQLRFEQSVAVNMTFGTTADLSSEVTNIAQVSSEVFDPNLANNVASASGLVDDTSVLALTGSEAIGLAVISLAFVGIGIQLLRLRSRPRRAAYPS